ncbi:MAG: OsmC family protein [Xanthomonadales bacterium]|jgi:organic hydroperoxide reductase OsmC/OhrA|nr:OsmC family protein [Xanthomonadales bacterium]
MSESIGITLEQIDGYEFRVRFDKDSIADLHTDLAEPLGKAQGPNPEHLLNAAIANCLSASLLFALNKFKNTTTALRARARATVGRNAENRMRVESIEVTIELPDAAASYTGLERALAQFESFCTVTESVRHGIAVDLNVVDATGTRLHHSRAGGD